MKPIPLFLLCVLLGAGAAIASLAVDRSFSVTARSPDRKSVDLGSTPEPTSTGALVDVPLGTSEAKNLQSLSLEQRKQILQRLWASIRTQAPTLFTFRLPSASDLHRVANVIRDLDFQQTEALLDTLPSPATSNRELLEYKTLFLERMACLDPTAVFERGTQMKDPRWIAAALEEIARKSASDALRKIADMPEELRNSIRLVPPTMSVGVAFGGTVAELQEVLRDNPELAPKGKPSGVVYSLLSHVLAKEARHDPERALANLRQFFTSSNSSGKTGVMQPSPLAFPPEIFHGLIRELRRMSPATVSSLLDKFDLREMRSVPSNLISVEGAERCRRGGLEAALQFAERYSDQGIVSAATNGAWRSLARQDRQSAVAWIEDFPQGPIRSGIFQTIADEARGHLLGHGRRGLMLQIVPELPSRSARMDYLTNVLRRRTDPSYDFYTEIEEGSRIHAISNLAVSDSEREELLRKTAPIPSE